MKVPTIYKAYVREYTQNMAVYGTVPPFQDPEIPIERMDTIGHCWVSAGYGSCKVLNLTFLDGQTNQIMEVSRESIKYAHVPAPNGKTVKHLRQKKHELESFGSC